MKKNLKSFSAVTSSMLSDLIDADMDINPVITPVFDMTNMYAGTEICESMLFRPVFLLPPGAIPQAPIEFLIRICYPASGKVQTE